MIVINLIAFAAVIIGQPIQNDDAPIQTIVIRPLTSIQKHPSKQHTQRAIDHPNTTHIESSSSSPVIRVLKNPSLNYNSQFTHRTRNHFNALIRASEAYPIYYAQAKANGNFHTIRVLKLE